MGDTRTARDAALNKALAEALAEEERAYPADWLQTVCWGGLMLAVMGCFAVAGWVFGLKVNPEAM